jgi:protein gp37
MALRLAHMALADIDAGRDPGRKRHYLDVVDLERRCWNGRIKLVPEALDDPMHWRKPRTVFVDSMSDLFHEDVPTGYLDGVFHTMSAPQMYHPHTYLMYEYISEAWPNLGTIYPHIWLGVTCEDQKRADERIPWLLRTSARIRFVSIEPMLGPIDLYISVFQEPLTPFNEGRGWPHYCNIRNLNGNYGRYENGGLNFVIVGGETGPNAREMNPDWARSVRDQCKASGTAFFFKQMSKRAPIPNDLLIREWPEIHP